MVMQGVNNEGNWVYPNSSYLLSLQFFCKCKIILKLKVY